VQSSLTLALGWYALQRADTEAVLSVLARFDTPWLVPLAWLLAAQAGLLCLRFRLILSGIETRRPFGWPIARTVLLGLLFGQLLPFTFGGDVARVALLRRVSVPLKTAATGVFVDRAAALLTMLLTMAASFPLIATLPAGAGSGARTTLLWLDAGAAVGSMAVVVALLSAGGLVRSIGRFPRLASLVAGLPPHLPKPRRLLAVLLVGIAGHAATVLIGLCVAAGMGIPLSPGAAFLLIPPALLVAQLPVSVAGWGVRETALVVALGLAGLSPTDAVSVSVGIGLACLFQGGLAGFASWVAGPAAAGRLPLRARAVREAR